jgi:uncharacterized protein YodC (DUF2158 family)
MSNDGIPNHVTVAGPVDPALGAVVRLNNGGPNMLVFSRLPDGSLYCAWQSGNGIVRQAFPEDAVAMVLARSPYDRG